MTRDELQALLRGRGDVETLGHLPVRDANAALRRSVPRTHDAVRLVDAIRELLGARGWLDPYAREGATKIALRDGDWLLPGYLVTLHLDVDRPPPPPPMEMPPELQAQVEAAQAASDAYRKRHPEPDVVPLGPDQRSATLMLREGGAHYRFEYGLRGVRTETSTAGSGDRFSTTQDSPFRFDPHARPPQLLPLGLLLRPELDPGGHPIEVLAAWIAELDIPGRQRLRARVPAAVPGGLDGVRGRGLRFLRERAWAEGLPEEAGWLVIDSFNGVALASGATLDEAHEAWLNEVESLQPLPPRPKPVELPEPQEPTASASADEEEGSITIQMQATIVIVPEMEMPWPPARPENTPCLAVPIPALPPTPTRWTEAGFTRRVRLLGEHGECGFVLVRDEEEGWTLIGDALLDAVDPRELEPFFLAQDERNRSEHRDHFGHGSPWEQPRYPLKIISARAWDASVGRWNEGLQSTSYSWTAGLGEWGWDVDRRLLAQRVWRVEVAE